MLMMKIEMFHVRSVAATFLPLSTIRPLFGRLRFRLRPMSSWLCLSGLVQPLVFQLLLSLQPLFGHSGRSRCCPNRRFFHCVLRSLPLLRSLSIRVFGCLSSVNGYRQFVRCPSSGPFWMSLFVRCLSLVPPSDIVRLSLFGISATVVVHVWWSPSPFVCISYRGYCPDIAPFVFPT